MATSMREVRRGLQRRAGQSAPDSRLTPHGRSDTPKTLEAENNRRIKQYDDIVTKIQGIRQFEPRKRLFLSPTLSEMKWLQSDSQTNSSGAGIHELRDRHEDARCQNEERRRRHEGRRQRYEDQKERHEDCRDRPDDFLNTHKDRRYMVEDRRDRSEDFRNIHEDSRNTHEDYRDRYEDFRNTHEDRRKTHGDRRYMPENHQDRREECPSQARYTLTFDYEHTDNEECLGNIKSNLIAARKSIHEFRCHVNEIETRPKSALLQMYTQTTTEVPDWFKELFLDGPVTFKLRPTFDIDAAATSDECRDMMEAEFTITVSPLTEIGPDCQVFVTEKLNFPYNGTLSRKPFDNFLQSEWRKDCRFSATTKGLFCDRRVSMSGVAENAVYAHLHGNNSHDLRLRQGRTVRLVFIDDENSGGVRGIYRRQMTTQPYFLTWAFTEEWVND